MDVAIVRSFAYPLQKNNLWILAAALATYFLPQVLAWVFPISALLVAILQAALVVYFALFMQGILELSMAGKESFPGWPEQSSGFAYAESVLGILGPYVVSFLPLIALRCLYADFGTLGRQGFGVLTVVMSGPIPYAMPRTPEWFEPASWACAAVGLIYLPMALLVWSFFGGNAVLNPVTVIRQILRASVSYALTVALIAGLLFWWWMMTVLLAKLPVDWARSFLAVLTLVYVLCVAMRLIGLHYYLNRHALQWERRPD